MYAMSRGFLDTMCGRPSAQTAGYGPAMMKTGTSFSKGNTKREREDHDPLQSGKWTPKSAPSQRHGGVASIPFVRTVFRTWHGGGFLVAFEFTFVLLSALLLHVYILALSSYSFFKLFYSSGLSNGRRTRSVEAVTCSSLTLSWVASFIFTSSADPHRRDLAAKEPYVFLLCYCVLFSGQTEVVSQKGSV
jgi:hypothetical protein